MLAGLSGCFCFSHSIAGAFDQDGFAVVQESVEDRGGQSAVAVEDGGPVLVGFIGGDVP